MTRVLSSTKILINSGAAFVSSHFQDFVLFNILDSGNNSGEFDHHDTEFIIRPKDYYIPTFYIFRKCFQERNEKLEYLVDLERILLAGNPGVVLEFEILISFYKSQTFYIISMQRALQLCSKL